MKIEDITTEQYVEAFNILELNDMQKKLIVLNYDSPEHTITSHDMALKMGFAGMAAANLKYGTMAKKFCEYFSVIPNRQVKIFVSITNLGNSYLWVLRPRVVLALEKIRWVTPKVEWNNVIQEVEDYKGTEDFNNIDETERNAIIKSRVGQGKFRASLIEVWGECSVTECSVIDVLRASHIKPWRFSTNTERLDPYNGLLLLPNLDALFDIGLISFENSGNIIISKKLSSATLDVLNFDSKMRIQKIDDRHLPYLKFHRENIFKS